MVFFGDKKEFEKFLALFGYSKDPFDEESDETEYTGENPEQKFYVRLNKIFNKSGELNFIDGPTIIEYKESKKPIFRLVQPNPNDLFKEVDDDDLPF